MRRAHNSSWAGALTPEYISIDYTIYINFYEPRTLHSCDCYSIKGKIIIHLKKNVFGQFSNFLILCSGSGVSGLGVDLRAKIIISSSCSEVTFIRYDEFISHFSCRDQIASALLWPRHLVGQCTLWTGLHENFKLSPNKRPYIKFNIIRIYTTKPQNFEKTANHFDTEVKQWPPLHSQNKNHQKNV